LERWTREEAAEDRRLAEQALAQEQALRVTLMRSDGHPPVVSIGAIRRDEAGVPMVEHDGRWHTLH
jgi:hypothetical protein